MRLHEPHLGDSLPAMTGLGGGTSASIMAALGNYADVGAAPPDIGGVRAMVASGAASGDGGSATQPSGGANAGGVPPPVVLNDDPTQHTVGVSSDAIRRVLNH